MTDLLTALALLFVTASALLIVANHFGLSPVPFYIIAGLITGAFVDQAELLELAQWGIAFLVFVFGIRVDFSALQTVMRDGEAAAVTQLLIVAPIAFGVGLLFGEYAGFTDPVRNALYFSAAATLSSTIVGAGLLEHEIRDNLVHGRLASSIHFFDDLVAIVLILILSAEVFTADAITSNLGYGLLFIVASLLIYRHGFPLMRRLAGGSDELVLMGCISILIGFLAAAEFVGLSIVIGAFAAGIAIRDEDVQLLGVRNGIDSIRDFFVAIFFVTVGALVVANTLPDLETLLLASLLVALVLVVNPLVIMAAFLYEGYDIRTSSLASSSLNQVSELSLVIAIQGLILGTITETVFDAIILAAAITMIVTSLTRENEKNIYDALAHAVMGHRKPRKVDERSVVSELLTDHTIVVGYGRQGKQVVDTLEELDRPYVVIENDPLRWNDLRAECENYILSDARTPYSWEKAKLGQATLIISTVDHQPVSETILSLESDAETILRAGSSHTASELLEAGATYVTVTNVLAADQLLSILENTLASPTTSDQLRHAHLEDLSLPQRKRYLRGLEGD